LYKVDCLELIKGHAHGHVGMLNHLHELFEANLAVAVQVGLHDGLVDNLPMISRLLYQLCPVATHLLQLLVLQVTAHHHLQHNKELAVADESVTVDVVYAEGKP
jgi:hypothetical protein